MSSSTSALHSSRRIAYAAGIVALIALITAAGLWLTHPSVAYIDSARLMQRYDGAIAVRQQLQTKEREWRGNVQTLRAEASALGERLTTASLSPAALQATRDSLQAAQKRLDRYRRAVENKAQSMRQELMQPVYDQLNADIQRFGEEEGYDLVFGTVSGGNILYAREATDITDEFLDHIGNDGPAAPAADSTAASAQPAGGATETGMSRSDS
jgi:outer membrane protein